MISYLEALEILKKSAKPLSSCDVPIIGACGRVLAEDVRAGVDIQPFDNSAMDGFAVRMADFEGLPVTLDVAQTIAAGDASQKQLLQSKTCMAIMTGAMLPDWAEAVVPVEQAARNGNNVTFQQAPKVGDHIRRRGQDFKAGDVVVRKGTKLTPEHVMALAAVGCGKVLVNEKPKVCFIATGRELQEAGSGALEAGKIYNSNLPYALCKLADMGLDCVSFHAIGDDPALYSRTVSSALDAGCEIIISSGAVSAGDFDFVKKALEDMGAKILFHKVAIKPGKPVLFAQFPNGTLYFGLPGNPTSAAVGLRFFVQPFLDACLGVVDEGKACAVLDASFRKKNDLRHFLKAHVSADVNGQQRVTLLDGQESFKVSPFLKMNAWAVIPEELKSLEAGSVIETYAL